MAASGNRHTIGNEGVLGATVFFGDAQSFGETIVQAANCHAWRMSVEAFVAEMALRGAFYNGVVRYSQALMSKVMQTTVCNGIPRWSNDAADGC